jgi:hypothetical protein
MFSTDPGRDDAGPSACGSEGESLEIVATGESEPLAIEVVYMKFFVDTADVAEIKDPAASGLLDGATSDPSLIKSGRPMLDVITEICPFVPGPVGAETVLQAGSDRQRPESLSRRLGEDQSIHPLTRSDTWGATER